jgi:acetoin utilization deacetylase AcuC-like enzyme
LLRQGTLGDADFVAPIPATREQLALAHTAEYLRKIDGDDFTFAERMRLEIPFSEAGRDAMVLCCGGTHLAGRLALERGRAGHLGGGFHHAYAGHGEGFCLLNDVAVAARALVHEGAVERVAIVDLDVHHGNGTASIFADDPAVFTLSVHQEHNYPAHKPPSDLDIGLEDGVRDEEYLGLLEPALEVVLGGRATKGASEHAAPDLVLYLAGADPYADDQLGGLRLTLDGLRRRDRMVFEATRSRGVPVAVVLAGGYAHRLDDTVAIHTATIEELVAAGA